MTVFLTDIGRLLVEHIFREINTNVSTMKIVLAFLVACASISSIQCTVCKVDTECGAGECCYIKPEFMVVSKRESVLPLQPISTHHDTGICEAYKLEHASCWPLEKANGHCSCGAGLSCQFVPAETLAPALAPRPVEARSIYMPGPGTFQCEKITTS